MPDAPVAFVQPLLQEEIMVPRCVRCGTNVLTQLYPFIGLGFAVLVLCIHIDGHFQQEPAITMVRNFQRLPTASNRLQSLPSASQRLVPGAFSSFRSSQQVNEDKDLVMKHKSKNSKHDEFLAPNDPLRQSVTRSSLATLAVALALGMTQPHQAALASIPIDLQSPQAKMSRFPTALDGFDNSNVPSSYQGNVARREKTYSPAQYASAAFQWSVIAAVAYNVYGGNIKANLVRLAAMAGLAEMPGKALVGTRLAVRMMFRRERDTWMEAWYGQSGRSVEVSVAVKLEEGGVVRPLEAGPFSRLELGPGTWKQDGDTLRINFELVSGLDRFDLRLPKGERIYLRCNAWGNVVANKGTMLVRKSRWVVRQEWRTAGRFTTEVVPEGEDIKLEPARMDAGEIYRRKEMEERMENKIKR